MQCVNTWVDMWSFSREEGAWLSFQSYLFGLREYSLNKLLLLLLFLQVAGGSRGRWSWCCRSYQVLLWHSLQWGKHLAFAPFVPRFIQNWAHNVRQWKQCVLSYCMQIDMAYRSWDVDQWGFSITLFLKEIYIAEVGLIMVIIRRFAK